MFGKDIDKFQLIHTILWNKILTNNHLFDSQPTFATQKKNIFLLNKSETFLFKFKEIELLQQTQSF